MSQNLYWVRHTPKKWNCLDKGLKSILCKRFPSLLVGKIITLRDKDVSYLTALEHAGIEDASKIIKEIMNGGPVDIKIE